jgi:hypothetical protein
MLTTHCRPCRGSQDEHANARKANTAKYPILNSMLFLDAAMRHLEPSKSSAFPYWFQYANKETPANAARDHSQRKYRTPLSAEFSSGIAISEKHLPFALAGKLFGGIKRQVEAERETAQHEAIRANAADLAKKIVRVVEEPEPIYHESLSTDKMAELERRIFRLLRDGSSLGNIKKVLNLSERDAAIWIRICQHIDGWTDVPKVLRARVLALPVSPLRNPPWRRFPPQTHSCARSPPVSSPEPPRSLPVVPLAPG